MSECNSGVNSISQLRYNTMIGLFWNYSVFNNYFRSLCYCLINLPLPHDCWYLPYLPLFEHFLVSICFAFIACFALVFILKQWSLFMHVGSNVKICLLFYDYSCPDRRPVVWVLKCIAYPSQKSEQCHEYSMHAWFSLMIAHVSKFAFIQACLIIEAMFF